MAPGSQFDENLMDVRPGWPRLSCSGAATALAKEEVIVFLHAGSLTVPFAEAEKRSGNPAPGDR